MLQRGSQAAATHQLHHQHQQAALQNKGHMRQSMMA
jgi:hypothetical protein